ncbi:MAG: putative bifunctional diguanylate cyclase/phosphodiesterase [Acidimicrobiia bacterium]
MTAESTSARRSIWAGVAIAAAVLLVAVHLLAPTGAVGEVTYLVALVGSGVFAVWGAARRSSPTRAAWSWIALGVCLSGLGDVTYSIYQHTQGIAPDISVADVPWLASYVAIAVGLFKLLRASRLGDRRDIDGMIDMAVVGVVSLLIVWQVGVQATLTDTSLPIGVRVVWASYPILDAALLALVVRTALTRRSQFSGGLLLTAGVTCWLFSDFFYMLFPASTSWVPWLDAGWMIGAYLLAAATWEHAPRGARQRLQATHDDVGAGRIALAIAPLLVPAMIEVWGHVQGDDPNPVPLLAATLVLAGLAFVRAIRLLRRTALAQAELQSTEQQFRALVQHSSDAAFILDPDGTIRYVSPVAKEEFGYEPEDLVGRLGWDMIHPEDLPDAIEAFGALGTLGAHARAELRIRDGYGAWRWVEEVVTNLLEEPAIEGLVVNIRDISVRKAAEQALSRMAHYDRLTGLPNRWLLTEHLEEAFRGAHDAVTLFIIDLDQFKFVNDSRGHAIGDRLLRAVADRLVGIVPAGDTIARIGGDEFAILSSDIGDAAAARARSRVVLDAIQEPFELEGAGRFFVCASVGIASAVRAETPDRLLQQADTAMYAAKKAGRSQSVIYDERLRSQADERLTIEADLRTALTAGELVVHYQPVVDLDSVAITGVEALVRWRHPSRGLLMPAEFIPIAEESALIERIGAFVLRQACEDAVWWTRAGSPLSIAVNISAAQLCQEHLAGDVRSVLYDTGLSPDQLVLEITETALLVGAERAMANVAALRSLGVHVALDDFGTGYSSLSYLKRVPSDIVKIDRSFVEGVAESPVDRDIVGAIIDLAHALGRTVIAEGIETDAQCAELRRLGCKLAQGFLWSAAVQAEAVLPLAQAGFGATTMLSEAGTH